MISWGRSLSRAAHRWGIYPTALALRGELGMYDFLRTLESLQWEPPEVLRSRQKNRLARLLSHAAETVPFYRRQWELTAPVGEDQAFTILRQLPVLTKHDLQQEKDELCSEERPRRISAKTTGGSTGQPVTVLKDRKALAYERAASWLGYGWFDIEIGDRGARFWGSPTDVGGRWLRFAAADLVMNRIRFSAFAFEDEDLEDYWKRCLRWRPDYFYGYVSMLTEFARHLRERGHDGGRLDLKAIVTTAEALASPQRSLLEEVFDAPVQNEYGCGEVGAVAYECPEGSLHVMADNLVVEVVRDDGSPAAPGESGEILLTDLANRAMPLVRYRVGDRAVLGDDCPCGRGFPVLKEIRGRAYDFVRDCEGRRYHGEFFMYLFEDLRDRGSEIDQFRVTQQSERELTVEVEASGALREEDVEFLRTRIDRKMSGMRVSIRRVDEIERLDSGKTRIIRNRWLSADGSR